MTKPVTFQMTKSTDLAMSNSKECNAPINMKLQLNYPLSWQLPMQAFELLKIAKLQKAYQSLSKRVLICYNIFLMAGIIKSHKNICPGSTPIYIICAYEVST